MDFQQPHQGYMRPPPPPAPSSMDPSHHQQPIPPPPGNTWFSGQFQYNHHSPSPPPPPPPNQQWAPQPPYTAPPPYHAHHQYPPPASPARPPVPHPSQVSQSYPPGVNQEWQNPNWGHNQAVAHNNGEDWASKARAWAAKTTTDNQYPGPGSQFTSVGRMEENQYNYTEAHHMSVAASSYHHQYPPPVPPPYRGAESASLGSGYIPDGHLPFMATNGNFFGNSNAAFPHQETLPSSLPVHQQEVPSSYSSVTGKEEAVDQNEKVYDSPWAFNTTMQQHAQPPPGAVGIPVTVEQPHFAFGHQSAGLTSDLSDQPLDFSPRFSHDHDPHLHPNYTQDSVPSLHAWASPAAPGVLYPPLHPSAFPGDAYGASGVPDRPKKALPNWFREEIIKKKSVIATSAQHTEGEGTSVEEEEAIDKSLESGDPADSKSVDSSRSTEEEDDEEDDVEAARTAAMNQEIKHVLTQVLLKVTDELFDEIATKVLSEEDDLTIKASNASADPPPPKAATAKVLISSKTKEADSDDVSGGKSILTAPGDLLGLASYASDDDDEDDEIKNSGVPNSFNSNGLRRESVHGNLRSSYSSKTHVLATDSETKVTGAKVTMYKDKKVEENVALKTEPPVENFSPNKLNRGDESTRRQDERKGKERGTDDRNGGSKDRMKEQGSKAGEKTKDSSYSRKRSIDPDDKEGRKETKNRRDGGKEDNDRKRDGPKDDKGERSKHHKPTSDSSKHKRRRSSPSDGESSDESRRKGHSSKRNLSPSPVRSRRRQVSRSPHNKHSQRRHSPYSSSLETTRGKRSRSRSPARRKR